MTPRRSARAVRASAAGLALGLAGAGGAMAQDAGQRGHQAAAAALDGQLAALVAAKRRRPAVRDKYQRWAH